MGIGTSKEVFQSQNMSTCIRPLLFHEINGKNIILKNNKTVARRIDGYNYGISFTSRPVLILEHVVVQINDVGTNWSGAVRIGFTSNDPKDMRSKIPAHSCPDLVSSPGNWAKALPESVNVKDNILSFYVDVNGDVYYGINDGPKQFLLSGVNTSTKLWGLIDVYGNTVEVELLGPHLYNSDDDKFDNDTNLTFHKVHGRTVSIMFEDNIAKRNLNLSCLSYVFTNRPLKFNEKVILAVVDVDYSITTPLEYGVTSCNPATISPADLPIDTDDFLDWPDYWVVHLDSNVYDVKDVLIFNITPEGKFLVFKNSTSRSAILHVDITKPLWLFIKFSGAISTLKLKGSSTKDYTHIMREYEESLTDDDVVELPAAAANSAEKSLSKSVGCMSLEEKSPKSECVICYDKQVNCALYKCGHMCMCFECAKTLSNQILECPICRKPIQDVIKVYT